MTNPRIYIVNPDFEAINAAADDFAADSRTYHWQSDGMSVTLSWEHLEDNLSVRIPDPWWRKPLVRFGILSPRYRKCTLEEYLDNLGSTNQT